MGFRDDIPFSLPKTLDVHGWIPDAKTTLSQFRSMASGAGIRLSLFPDFTLMDEVALRADSGVLVSFRIEGGDVYLRGIGNLSWAREVDGRTSNQESEANTSSGTVFDGNGDPAGKRVVSLGIYTTCDMLCERRLTRVERLFDVSGICKVSRIWTRSGLEKKVSRFEGNLDSLRSKRSNQCFGEHTAEYSHESSLGVHAEGGTESLSFDAYFFLLPQGVRIKSYVSRLSSWLSLGTSGDCDRGFSTLQLCFGARIITPTVLSAIRNLLIDIAIAADAFHGYCGLQSMNRQLRNLLQKAERLPLPDYNRELPDVYWLNYFGPAFRPFWGEDKIGQLGERYNLTHFGNKGFLVQTTDWPPEPDLSIENLVEYNFKKHFYSVVGQDTFMHESQPYAEAGQFVPVLDAHRHAHK